MKKIFLSTLFIAGTALTMVSCNNGAYDADPTTNNSNIPNPLGSGVTLGNIRAKFNGNEISFGPSNYGDVDQPVKYRSVAGYTDFGTSDQKLISINIEGYDVTKTYNYGSGAGTLGGISYTIVDVPNNNKVKAIYSNATGNDGKGHVRVTVDLDANNQFKGSFDAVLYKYDGSGALDLNDSIVVTEGVFYVPKK